MSLYMEPDDISKQQLVPVGPNQCFSGNHSSYLGMQSSDEESEDVHGSICFKWMHQNRAVLGACGPPISGVASQPF